MPPDRLQLPLQPAGASLASHVAALDLLAAKLDALPTRARWPARVPLNGKASFDGEIVHTNDLKVNVGGEWWVDMGAEEAAQYVRRRRQFLLDEHARMIEGRRPREHDALESSSASAAPAPVPTGGRRAAPPEIRFDPALASPTAPGEDTEMSTSPAVAAATAPPKSLDKGKGKDTGDIDYNGLPPSLKNLVDIMHQTMGDQLKPPPGTGESTVNDEGDAIHEIREALDGTTLGDVPAGEGEGAVTVKEDNDDDYFSPAAVARRAALRKKLFHEDSDTEGSEDESMDVDHKEQPSMDVEDDDKTPTATSGRSLGHPLTLAPSRDDPMSPPNRPLSPFRTPSHSRASSIALSPNAPPKGILKQPQRKKSVSFDASVPLPPESPPPPGGPKMGFPLDKVLADGNEYDFGATRDAYGRRPVPILAPPKPRAKGAPATPDTFAGFSRGFLAKPVEIQQQQSVPKIVEIPPDAPEESAQKPAVEEADVKPEEPKKPSLFAQRRAGAGPSLPKLSEAKPMAVMKTGVVENEAAPTVPPTVGSDATTSIPPTVGTVPPTVGSVPPIVGSSSSKPEPPVVIVDDTDDESDYGDLGDFSDDEEDEYALDEALLQREVALEYHRRQAWQRPLDEDDFDPEDPSHPAHPDNPANAGANVLMGVPRVSTITGGENENDPLRIVNPTADDLSQFLRVGRAEDGELVFEPPVVNEGSDDEDEDDADDAAAQDRRERRARRQDTMARLLRGDYEDDGMGADPAAVQRERERGWQASLPPSVQPLGGDGMDVDDAEEVPLPRLPTFKPAAGLASAGSAGPSSAASRAGGRVREATRDVVERPTVSGTPTAPAPPEAPKKVSRFKAARGGQ